MHTISRIISLRILLTCTQIQGLGAILFKSNTAFHVFMVKVRAMFEVPLSFFCSIENRKLFIKIVVFFIVLYLGSPPSLQTLKKFVFCVSTNAVECYPV